MANENTARTASTFGTARASASASPAPSVRKTPARANRRAPRSARLALAIPAVLFLLAFMVVPMALLVVISFQDAGASAFTVERYANLLTSPTYLTDIVVTLGVALLTTALVLLLAYPAASLLVNAKRKWVRTLLYVVLVSPLLTSVVVRSFAWVVMLSQNGLVNQLLETFGIIDEPLTLLWNMGAVVLAYVQVLLPFAVLPLTTSLGEVRPQLRQASMSLGAGRARSFFSVVLPLTIPGAVNGGVIVFSLTAGSYITPLLIGGGTQPILPLAIYQQAIQISDLNMAAAMAVVLLVLVVAIILPVEFFLKRWEAKIYG